MVGSYAVKGMYDWEERLIAKNEALYDKLKEGVALQTERTDKFRTSLFISAIFCLASPPLYLNQIS